MIKQFPKKRLPSTLLSLAFDGPRLEGAVVRRSNGSLRVFQTLNATLTLNPLTSAPELVGREIKNALDAAGIRERNCIVCIPLAWALTMTALVPAIPDEDVASFIELEAERGLPYAPETLFISHSRIRSDGEAAAVIAAVPRNHILQLERVLKAAQLKAHSFTFGVSALSNERQTEGSLALAIGENTVDLQISHGGGTVALRSLDEVIESEAGRKSIDADALGREIRVTLGQLPMELRGAIRRARIFGSSDMAERAASEITLKLERMGMRADRAKSYAPDEFRSQFPADTRVSPALSAAARLLTGAASPFEFLPPHISVLQKLTERISSRRLGSAAAAAAILILLIGGAIGAQQWKLSRLQSKWSGMQAQVGELENTQQLIRRYRPWFDESAPSLSILARVTEAFPMQGSVTAKMLEVRNQSQVLCSGAATDNASFMTMIDQLRANENVRDLKVDSLRGRAPLQFSFNFQWSPGGGGGAE